MKMLVLCDGEGVSRGILADAILPAWRRHIVIDGPRVCGMAARTGDIWCVSFEHVNPGELLLVSGFYRAVLKRILPESACIKREWGMQGKDPVLIDTSTLETILARMDYLDEEIRAAVSDLRRTRSIIGHKRFSEIRLRLEKLIPSC